MDCHKNIETSCSLNIYYFQTWPQFQWEQNTSDAYLNSRHNIWFDRNWGKSTTPLYISFIKGTAILLNMPVS